MQLFEVQLNHTISYPMYCKRSRESGRNRIVILHLHKRQCKENIMKMPINCCKSSRLLAIKSWFAAASTILLFLFDDS